MLSNPGLESVAMEIQNGIEALQGTGKVLLVIDQLDLLLAAGGERVDAVGLEDMLMGIREVCCCLKRKYRVEVDFILRMYTLLS